MTTEGIDPHNALFLLLNNHRRKSDERSRPFIRPISSRRHWAARNQSGAAGMTGRDSFICHFKLGLTCAFALLSVINDEIAFMKGLSPAGFHMWAGSLLRMITSLKACRRAAREWLWIEFMAAFHRSPNTSSTAAMTQISLPLSWKSLFTSAPCCLARKWFFFFLFSSC